MSEWGKIFRAAGTQASVASAALHLLHLHPRSLPPTAAIALVLFAGAFVLLTGPDRPAARVGARARAGDAADGGVAGVLPQTPPRAKRAGVAVIAYVLIEPRARLLLGDEGAASVRAALRSPAPST